MMTACVRCHATSRLVTLITYGTATRDFDEVLGGPYCAACEESVWLTAVMPVIDGVGADKDTHTIRMRAQGDQKTCRRCLRPQRISPESPLGGLVARRVVEIIEDESLVLQAGETHATLICPDCRPAIYNALKAYHEMWPRFVALMAQYHAEVGDLDIPIDDELPRIRRFAAEHDPELLPYIIEDRRR